MAEPKEIPVDSSTNSAGLLSETTEQFGGGPIGPFASALLHARGGLGEVFRATDTALNRVVAVKCLQASRSNDTDCQRRFLIEAEITARLEHPGVVPVYALCGDEIHGPAYAMRFIEGPNFADSIKAFHCIEHNPVVFRRLLQSFLQVCQTVAYAHSRGVIHRDLKPQNVVLGKYGETLVVDWGLAKIVGRPDELRSNPTADATLALSPLADNDGSKTQMGSAVGTPAYMSPEQAAGRWNVVDHHSDVYGLGAILYTLLCGQPPLSEGDWPEMQQKIQRGDFPSPLQRKVGVSRALDAVCLRAMECEPSSRYSSANSLAEDIEHWLADEPVTAFQESAISGLWRWIRRHHALVSAVVALLLTALIGLSIGTVLLQQSRNATELQRRAAEASREKSEFLNRFLIDDLLKQADPINNRAGDRITVRQLLDKASERLGEQSSLANLPAVEAEIRGVIGHAYEYLGVFDRAEAHYHRAWLMLSRLDGPESLKTLEMRNRFGFALASQAPRTETESMAKATLNVCERVLGPNHPETADAANILAEVYSHMENRSSEAVVLRQRASRILNATLGPDENRTIEIDNNYGVSLVLNGQPAEASVVLQSVIDRRRVLSPDHYEFGRNLSNLGGALVASGKFTEAVAPLEEASVLSQKSFDKQGELSARNLLATALEGSGNAEAAEDIYLAVLAERRSIAEQAPFLPRTLGALTNLYAKQKEWSQAAIFLVELIRIDRQDSTAPIEYSPEELAAALDVTQQPMRAEILLGHAYRSLSNCRWKGDWLTAEISSRHANVLRMLGRFEEAEKSLLQADTVISKAAGAPDWGRSVSRSRLFELYNAWRKPDEASKWR